MAPTTRPFSPTILRRPSSHVHCTSGRLTAAAETAFCRQLGLDWLGSAKALEGPMKQRPT